MTSPERPVLRWSEIMFLLPGNSEPCCRLMVGLVEVWALVSKWCVQDGCRMLLSPGCSMACQATWAGDWDAQAEV